MLSFIQASLEFTFRDHLGILIEMLGIPSDGEHLPLFMGASCPTDVVASTYGQNGVLNALRSSSVRIRGTSVLSVAPGS